MLRSWVMKKLLAIIVLGLLLPSCIATVKPTGGIYKEIQLSPEKSRIVIFRKGGSLIGMDTPAVNIVGDKTLSFYLPSKTFIQEDLKPGTYKIIVQKPRGDTGLVWRFDPIGQEVAVKKNQTVYLELKTFSVGIVHNTKLILEGKDYAIENISTMKRIMSSDQAKF